MLSMGKVASPGQTLGKLQTRAETQREMKLCTVTFLEWTVPMVLGSDMKSRSWGCTR
jgi:hypothetical protein